MTAKFNYTQEQADLIAKHINQYYQAIEDIENGKEPEERACYFCKIVNYPETLIRDCSNCILGDTEGNNLLPCLNSPLYIDEDYRENGSYDFVSIQRIKSRARELEKIVEKRSNYKLVWDK